MAIEARVADILSDTELALNAGTEQGVTLDDVVTVYLSVRISDPETEEELGTVNRPAIRLRISEVQARLAVARSIEPSSNPFSVFFSEKPTLKRITAIADRVDTDTVLVQRGSLAVIESGMDAISPSVPMRAPS